MTVGDAFAARGPYRSAARPSFGELPERPAEPPSRRAPSGVCPRCGGAMTLGGTNVAIECGACRGAFVPWRVLEEAIAVAAAPSASSEPTPAAPSLVTAAVTYLSCPVCGERMNRALYSPRAAFVVDVCAAHGLWFDAGEIERAARFPLFARPGRGARPRPPAAEGDAGIAVRLLERLGSRRTAADVLVDSMFDFLRHMK